MFPQRLRHLRKQHKLTQEQLGQKINVTKVSISGYENGKRTPDTETLEMLANYFQVSVDYLLGRTSNPTIYDSPITKAFQQQGENINEDELEYLNEELKKYRELKKKWKGK